jgi:hypothetical protein
MANENDASRDKKLLVGLIALVCAAPPVEAIWSGIIFCPTTDAFPYQCDQRDQCWETSEHRNRTVPATPA